MCSNGLVNDSSHILLFVYIFVKATRVPHKCHNVVIRFTNTAEPQLSSKPTPHRTNPSIWTNVGCNRPNCYSACCSRGGLPVGYVWPLTKPSRYTGKTLGRMLYATWHTRVWVTKWTYSIFVYEHLSHSWVSMWQRETQCQAYALPLYNCISPSFGMSSIPISWCILVHWATIW